MKPRQNAPNHIQTAVPDEECDLDLGAESPKSLLHEDIQGSPETNPVSLPEDPEHAKEWKESGLAVHTTVPPRPRDWHSQSYSERWEEDQQRQRKMKQKSRKGDENECNICFDPAFQPRRTPCCKTLYCLEHITDWLTGPDSAGQCPSCNTPCGISNGHVVLKESINFQTSNKGHPDNGSSETLTPVESKFAGRPEA
ncbi:hypothetical protein VKT23_010007 [Stygiomarasmius scandens]|uniref:RING-type domain-containing protein n=1 Tax=Marasmiellus scandens TaxID=2682957 RepID=A0ABR1JFE9_9AGAR